ncbi:MAG: hypothetical protein A2233_03395 [Candidatus Kerfeldbacteria bacterium RIFOXYA2_FULL_38_24]|uniref:Amidohydrolase-related domain-containing protein n=1 Tax=Candidatus Kerfeldbacteria bacterium RIFOXYB2_FULL_38_14 TaxID=1798547 RepID=A0A1G2BBR5_9BACT|nr:MAG: hypothetical protein A2233_03395 [Candidatus Kerfeldbacteria bacterium RIFOXYA2_FULL_38_24]OGY85637.1 MAG: hypothetical protein A2319_02635 [Candidatus Kerfeldbacteria bacterium RIFOXYB2_FULL_38_14]
MKKLFYNFRLFNGKDNTLFSNKILLVNDGIFKNILDIHEIKKYPQYQLCDLNGLTVLPGLIDAHVHITNFQFTNPIKPPACFQINKQRYLNLKTALKYGITTVRDLGGFPNFIQQAKKRIQKGELTGPRIIACNSFITTEDGPPERYPKRLPKILVTLFGGQMAVRTKTSAEVRRAALENIHQGVEFLKIHYTVKSAFYRGKLHNLSDESLRIIKDLADQHHLQVAIHHQENAGFKKAIQFGFNTVEHCSMEQLEKQDIEQFVQKKTALIPTLKIHYSPQHPDEILDYLYSSEAREDFTNEALKQLITDIEQYTKKPYPPADYQKKLYQDVEMSKKAWPITLENVARIKKAGGIIGAGTDAFSSGLSPARFYWKELECLTQAGFSNFEVLQMATIQNASIVGRKNELGSIEPNKYADFITVNGNPLQKLVVLKCPTQVFLAGECVYDQKKD